MSFSTSVAASPSPLPSSSRSRALPRADRNGKSNATAPTAASLARRASPGVPSAPRPRPMRFNLPAFEPPKPKVAGRPSPRPAATAKPSAPVVPASSVALPPSPAPVAPAPVVSVSVPPSCPAPARVFPKAPLKSCLRVRLAAAPKPAALSKPAPRSLARFGALMTPRVDFGDKEFEKLDDAGMAGKRLVVLRGQSEDKSLLSQLRKEQSRRASLAHTTVSFVEVARDVYEPSVDAKHGRELARQFGVKYDVPAPKTVVHVTVAEPKGIRVRWDPEVQRVKVFDLEDEPTVVGPALLRPSST
ncbi:hypothetical protein IWZ00DRAFT_487049 [Phyllosticta capitalensis]